MKKFISILLTAIILMTSFAVVSFAAEYEQPYPSYLLDSKYYRIPGILTLNDGSVMASMDARYEHGSDSPQNLDTVIRWSPDGYKWPTDASSVQMINVFDDYSAKSDVTLSKNSASFIDPAIIQSKTTGRIFVLVDAFPSGCGSFVNTQEGTGYIDVDGKKYLALTNTDDYTKSINDFEFYIGDFANGFATVYNRKDKTATAYTVDVEYKLYKDGKALEMKQKDTGATIQQSVFYLDSELTVFATMYQWLRWSDDNGKTWSVPYIITPQVKKEGEGFYAISPGRGFAKILPDGTERIFFSAYEKSSGSEQVSVFYSDDNGVTWTRAKTPGLGNNIGIGKTSESQIVELNNGVLRLYSRNKSAWLAYSDSYDNGKTWSTFKADEGIEITPDCMVSVINTSKKINGKPVILCSSGSGLVSGVAGRVNGSVRVGLVNTDNSIDWISSYRLNDGFFAYSCLTELADGNIAVLSEYPESGFITYDILTLDANGNLTEINGDDISQDIEEGFFEKIKNWFLRVWYHILRTLGIL